MPVLSHDIRAAVIASGLRVVATLVSKLTYADITCRTNSTLGV